MENYELTSEERIQREIANRIIERETNLALRLDQYDIQNLEKKPSETDLRDCGISIEHYFNTKKLIFLSLLCRDSQVRKAYSHFYYKLKARQGALAEREAKRLENGF